MPGKALASGRSLGRILDDDPQLIGWNRRRREEAAVTKAIGAVLPRPLAAHVAALLPAPDRLDLSVPTGTVAAALRQRLPAVVAALAREGMDFREVRVRVQPVLAPEPERKTVPRQRDSSYYPALERLEADLEPGELRQAVRRVLRRAGR